MKALSPQELVSTLLSEIEFVWIDNELGGSSGAVLFRGTALSSLKDREDSDSS